VGRDRIDPASNAEATFSWHSFSPEETAGFAARLAKQLKPNDVLLLSGDLGAGKTTFVNGLLQGLNSSDFAQSPTYVYLQIYEARLPVFHFDLYRLREPGDFLAIGFEEFFTRGGICLIEWPERILPLVPKESLHITLTASTENERTIELKQ